MPKERRRRPPPGDAANHHQKALESYHSRVERSAQALDWFFQCWPDQLLCLGPEPCPRCSGRILGYLLDTTGYAYGWRTQPLGTCGNPYRCGERPLGITPAEAFGWLA
jgi:hypothetical protein